MLANGATGEVRLTGLAIASRLPREWQAPRSARGYRRHARRYRRCGSDRKVHRGPVLRPDDRRFASQIPPKSGYALQRV
jgi:hypothetical protein